MTRDADNPAVGEGCSAGRGGHQEDLGELLDDPHCRYLLGYLRDSTGPVSVADAVTHVVSQLTDSPPDEISPDVERRVRTWFYHGQLPTLDDHGVVDFNPDSGTVELAADANHTIVERSDDTA